MNTQINHGAGLKCKRCDAPLETPAVHDLQGSILIDGREYVVRNAVYIGYLVCPICRKPMCSACQKQYGQCGHPEKEFERLAVPMRRAQLQGKN